MTFLAPWFLVGLAAAAALLLWGVLAPRGREVAVGSLLLWRRALGDGRTGRPSARLRLRDPALWLDAAGLALVVLACARPAVRTEAPLRPVATVVVDHSASMLLPAAAGAGPRWRAARRMAEGLFAPLGEVPVRVLHVPGPQGGVVPVMATAAGVPDAVSAYGGGLLVEGEAWAEAVRAARVGLGAAAAGKGPAHEVGEAALPQAREGADEAASSRPPVIFVTDVAPAGPVPEGVFVLAPGGEARGAGLVRVAVRRGRGRWWLLVVARAVGAGGGERDLVVSSSGRVLARRPRFLAGEGRAETVLAFGGPVPRRLRVDLAGGPDDFPADDSAFLSATGGGVSVALVGEAPPALRRALEAAGATRVLEVAPGERVSEAEADVVVAYRTAIPVGWAGPAVVVAPPGAVGPVRPLDQGARERSASNAPGSRETAGEAAAAPVEPSEVAEVWRVAADHPLADAFYLPPPRVRVPRYRLYSGGELVVGTVERPVVVTWRRGEVHRLAVLFDLEPSTTDWPRRPGFPVFWARTLAFLVGPGRAGAGNLATLSPREAAVRLGGRLPAEVGFVEAGGETVGVSFIGTEEGFESGPGQDDSAAARRALERWVRLRREATLAPLWPVCALLALGALVARSWLGR